MIKKRFIALNTALMLGISSYMGIPSASAAKDPAKQAEVDKAQATLNEVQAEITTLNTRISQINQAVKDNQNMIQKAEEDIVKTEKQVKTLDSEINELEEKNEKRQEILKKRAITYQQTNGNSNYLEVIFGSTSFGDFIERIGAVSTIVKADRQLIDEIQEDQTQLEDKQATVEEKLTGLKDMKTELVGMQEDIKQQQAQTNSLKEELKVKEEESQRQLAEAKARNIDIVIEPVVVKETSNVKEKVEQIANTQKEEVNSSTEKEETNSSSKKEETSSSTKNETTNKVNSSSKPANSNSSNKKPSSTNSSTQNKNIQTVISAGNKYIGNSVYVFGGGRTQADIAAGRFDCSGFVSWAFRQGGYSVPASTDALKGAGRQIPTSQMQPGDMVFFDTYKKDGHVGIYVGGGKFIGSQSSTGVAIASLKSGYWKQKFNGRVVRVH